MKRALLLGLVITLFFAFPGCGDSGNPETVLKGDPKKTDQGDGYTLYQHPAGLQFQFKNEWVVTLNQDEDYIDVTPNRNSPDDFIGVNIVVIKKADKPSIERQMAKDLDEVQAHVENFNLLNSFVSQSEARGEFGIVSYEYSMTQPMIANRMFMWLKDDYAIEVTMSCTKEAYPSYKDFLGYTFDSVCKYSPK